MIHRAGKLALAAILVGMVMSAAADTPGKQPAKHRKHASAAAGADWIFRPGTFSHDPRSGQRIWQYQAVRPIYRDPNAIADSAGGAFPFAPDAGEMEPMYPPTPYLFGPYSYGAYSGYGPYGAYNPYGPNPYFGRDLSDDDPNQELPQQR